MSAPHVSALLAQQLVNGTPMTTKQVEEAFTLAGGNRIKCDKVFLQPRYYQQLQPG